MLAVVGAIDAALDGRDRALVVGCSGGADSLALAAGAVPVARRRGLPLSALVVDHGLQPGSAAVAERAATVLRGLGVADTTVTRLTVTPGSGPEAAAREARYAALRAAAGEATILLGHTRDDQAETVLLGLARGSGVRSLAGMAPRSGPVLRPLLGLPRSTTEAACAELGLEVWSDPHNADPRFARARVRHRVLPGLEAELGPGVAAALARTADLARADADLLDRLAAEADPGGESLDCRAMSALPAALRGRVLRRWLRRRGAPEVGYQHVRAVGALLEDWHGQGPVPVPGLDVRRSGDRLHAEPRPGMGG